MGPYSGFPEGTSQTIRNWVLQEWGKWLPKEGWKSYSRKHTEQGWCCLVSLFTTGVGKRRGIWGWSSLNSATLFWQDILISEWCLVEDDVGERGADDLFPDPGSPGGFVSGRPLHLGFEAPCYDTGWFSVPRAVPRILWQHSSLCNTQSFRRRWKTTPSFPDQEKPQLFWMRCPQWASLNEDPTSLALSPNVSETPQGRSWIGHTSQGSGKNKGDFVQCFCLFIFLVRMLVSTEGDV